VTPPTEIRQRLVEGLNDKQRMAVEASERRTLIIAGAGSGKTEVIARRIALWVGVTGIPKERIVAFTFTDRAAEEMKFRIRRHLQAITPTGEDATLGGMYVGTIHAFCLKMLRELFPDHYHNFDVIDETARHALIYRGYHGILGLRSFQDALGTGQLQAIDSFSAAYDLLNEYNQLDVALAPEDTPHTIEAEREWCTQAALRTEIGDDEAARAFATAAARYYAYLLCRRFLDFSTSQSELVRKLAAHPDALDRLRRSTTHLVVDEVQDVNPIQNALIILLIGQAGTLTAVGDHRQAIYRFRGSRVTIMSELAAQLQQDADGAVYDLTHNYRSTPRIVSIANRWAATINAIPSLPSPAMEHGRMHRTDQDPTHTALLSLQTRADEAAWITRTIQTLIQPSTQEGAYHDTSAEGERGLTYSDIAILLRSSTNAREYMTALQRAGIPAIFRAGPDLFTQPEVLLFAGALGRAVDLGEFLGAEHGPSFPNQIRTVLGCQPVPEDVVRTACQALTDAGLPLDADADQRIIRAACLIATRLQGEPVDAHERGQVRTRSLAEWLGRPDQLRRVFPQAIYHWLLAEAGIQEWDALGPRGIAAMFHLGQLSNLVKGIETPGWTSPADFKYQIIALCLWGARNARTNEAPLLVQPDAVTISTVHAAKGLEYAAVFLADVCAQRFPNSRARTPPALPFSGAFRDVINPADLADNENNDDERRLMYVALTRAERYAFVSSSGNRHSKFFKELARLIPAVGGAALSDPAGIPGNVTHRRSEPGKEKIRLITSFTDLRYYLECPHDFYLRKVLGFAPTIDQAFGYGRGVHNLMRAIHTNPTHWAALAQDPRALRDAIQDLIRRGLFYLRYTTGDPRANMEAKALAVVTDYIARYAPELQRLHFEPEREFETLLPEEDTLVSGAIDVIRLDDPPRVTLIDFKSGDAESDAATKLDEDEMRLQISLYGLAAKRELEYEPDRGLVRYLGEVDPASQELSIPLSDGALAAAHRTIVETTRRIRGREFHSDPTKGPRDATKRTRCAECDFREFCGMQAARAYRASR
jgi:DNA helicase-2/ATP-dependent DNA helicase PcrA